MAEAGRLAGRIAVVTGAGQGIGRGCALRFAREGARVVALDVDAAALASLAGEAATLGVHVDATASVDLTDAAAASACIGSIGRQHGRIDVLLNAAAFANFAWIEDLTPEDWQRTLRGELDIVFLPTRAAWPQLKASGRASVIAHVKGESSRPGATRTSR